MLDYEVVDYKVDYWFPGGAYQYRVFDTEEEAVEYITTNRHKFEKYRLTQTRLAIIDF